MKDITFTAAVRISATHSGLVEEAADVTRAGSVCLMKITFLVAFMLFSIDAFGATTVQGQHVLELRYYPVLGANSIDTLDSLLFQTARERGMDTHGQTNTEFKWKATGLTDDLGKCTADTVELLAKTVITLPRLVNPALSPSELVAWESSVAELVEHEFLHYLS